MSQPLFDRLETPDWRRVPGLLGRPLGVRDESSADPYEPTLRAPLLRCRADGPEWDVQFPDHPLSRCRRHLQHVIDVVRSG